MLDSWTRSIKEIPITWGLVLTHFILYAYVGSVDPTFHPDTLRQMGGHVNPAIWNGEIHRLLFSGLLHGGGAHFLLNNIALAMLGRLLERLLGSPYFGLLYFAALIGGNLVSLVWMPPTTVSVGASGAIMGLAGALFVLLLLDRKERFLVAEPLGRSLFFFLVLFQLLVGQFIPVINNSAHLGGFAVGLCFGLFFWSRIPGTALPRNIGTAISVVTLVAFVGIGYVGFHPKDTYYWHLHFGTQAFQSKDTKSFSTNAKKAEQHLMEACEKGQESGDALYLLAELRFQQKKYRKAADVYALLVKKKPNQFTFWFRYLEALSKAGMKKRAEAVYKKASARFVETTPSWWRRLLTPSPNPTLAKARLLTSLHQDRKAILLYQELIRSHPEDVSLNNDYAWLLVTAHDKKFRAPALAVTYAQEAVKRSPNAAFLDTLAAAYDANGQWQKAIDTIKRAIHAPGAPWMMPHLHMQYKRFQRALNKHLKQTKKAPKARKEAPKVRKDAPKTRKEAPKTRKEAPKTRKVRKEG